MPNVASDFLQLAAAAAATSSPSFLLYRRPFPHSHSLFEHRTTWKKPSPASLLMDIATNDYGLERLFDDGASSSLPTAVDAAPPAPAHDWSDTAELIPSQLSFKGKAYGRHDRKMMLNDKNGCKARYVCKSKRTLGCPGALEAVLDCDTMEVAYTLKKPHCAACDSGRLVTDNVVDVRKEMSAKAATMATGDWASSAKDIANSVLTEFEAGAPIWPKTGTAQLPGSGVEP
eukprot:CAMPEP_0194572448 /NCGR_PEP_ID=MMETSP0292-20121207/9026_1 /TAXON_ID=39354 /ORGANISM="Heterosigma akashiwo, Strain CCMP2393" /LENGTH=229 /DNA_ID=CAMNT_0039423433 /DNA_START=62 /DNA_END=748 /DNA_ORIENTATION=+